MTRLLADMKHPCWDREAFTFQQNLLQNWKQRPTRSPIPPKSLRSNHYQRLFGDPTCRLAANNRSRILWKFNSCSECRNHDKGLLEKGLGWAAWKLHQAVARVVLQSLKVWLESPFVIQIGRFFDPLLCDDGWLAQVKCVWKWIWNGKSGGGKKW